MMASRAWVTAMLLLITLLLFGTHTASAVESTTEEAAAAAIPAGVATDSVPPASPLSAATDVDEVEVDIAGDSLPELPPAAAAQAAAARGGRVLNEEPISLQRADFCKACYTVVEEFHKWTVQNFHDPNARRNTTMTRNQLVEWFCRSGPFEHWKEPLVWGCIKTVQDHHDAVLQPFLGSHIAQEYTTLAAVFKHKIEACALPSVDACDPWVPEGRPRTDCEACSRVANDIHWSLTREQRVNASIVEKTLRVICMEVGMRHDKPMEVESFCHEYVDEHWKEMQRMLVKVYNDPSITDKARAVKKRFCGGMTEVCEAERDELAAEIKAKKEEERAKRMAARKNKKAHTETATTTAAAAATTTEAKDEL